MTRWVTFMLGVAAFCASQVARADEPAPTALQTQPTKEGTLQPPGPPPKDPVPAPATPSPAPPRAQPLEPSPSGSAPKVTAPAPLALPAGQWVYTNQYGWLWMPHEPAYTHVVPDSSLAYTYVFYPTFGWRWVVAPWVFGFGVAPYWGPLGPLRFGWYAHPWFRPGLPYRGPGWGRRPPLGRPAFVGPPRGHR